MSEFIQCPSRIEIKEEDSKLILHCVSHAGHGGSHIDELGKFKWNVTQINVNATGGQAFPPEIVETCTNQNDVFIRSLRIFKERTFDDGELWKTVDPIDTAHHIRHKAHRIYFAARRLEAGKAEDEAKARIIESALDTINYAAFIIRQIEGE